MDTLINIPICHATGAAPPADDCNQCACGLYYPFQLNGQWIWPDCCRTRRQDLIGLTDPAEIDKVLRDHPRLDRDR
jgi:hypothetical protein